MDLKKYRFKSSLIQREVAELLGVDRTTYVKYEQGSSEPPLAVLVRLADFYHVSVDDLIGHKVQGQEELSPSDLELLAAWRGAEDSARQIALETLKNHQRG